MNTQKRVIIDVREKDEFANEHIADSINLPLSELGRQAPGVLKNLDGCTFVLMCQSGKRAGLAKKQLEAMGFSQGLVLGEGGIAEWKKQGKPLQRSGAAVMPVMRQVQLTAGTMAFLGALLAWFINPAWILLSGFVGLGLMVAGATGFCGMAELLSLMPWNKGKPKMKCE